MLAALSAAFERAAEVIEECRFSGTVRPNDANALAALAVIICGLMVARIKPSARNSLAQESHP